MTCEKIIKNLGIHFPLHNTWCNNAGPWIALVQDVDSKDCKCQVIRLCG
jgi:hypothetical protein